MGSLERTSVDDHWVRRHVRRAFRIYPLAVVVMGGAPLQVPARPTLHTRDSLRIPTLGTTQ